MPALARPGGQGRRHQAVPTRPARGRGRHHPEGRNGPVGAIGCISISRGYDPRDFALVAFGGACARQALTSRANSVPVVIVRHNPASPRRSAVSSSTCSTTSRKVASSAPGGRSHGHRSAIRRAGTGSPRPADARRRRARTSTLQQIDRYWCTLASGARSRSMPDRSARSRPRRKLHTERKRDPIPSRQRPGQLLPPQPEGGWRRAKAEFAVPRRTEIIPDPVEGRRSGSTARRSTPPSTARPPALRFCLQGPALVEQVTPPRSVPPGTSAEVNKYLDIIIHVKESSRSPMTLRSIP